MRIALVITELDPGGAELCLTELALYLANKGHTVKLWAVGPAPSADKDGLVRRLNTAGIDVEFGGARSAIACLRVVCWLNRELKRFRPDIVQSMLWHANMVTAAALWFSRTPWVAGMRVSEPRSGRWWLERLASRRMQLMVCVSHDVYNHALEKERIAPSKVLVIPNGVHARLLDDQLAPGDWSQWLSPTAKGVLLFVGRLETQKGILPMIEHAPAFLNQHADWSLIIMGQGSLQATLQARIKSLALEESVHLLGWRTDAPIWMKAADLLVLPAEYEGMPNVLLEAMAVGKPFVAFAVDGVCQLVSSTDGYPTELAAAQLVPPGNWSEFTRMVLLQMEQAQLREQCGRANREHVSKLFKLDDQLAKYLTLYQSLVDPENTLRVK